MQRHRITAHAHLAGQGFSWQRAHANAQTGSILVIAIVFLFAMSVISLSSLSGVVTQERRASNNNAKSQAEHAALSAVNAFLRDLEAENAVTLGRLASAIEADVGGQIGPFDIPVPSATHEAEIFIRLLDQQTNEQNSQDADLSGGTIDSVNLELIARGFNVDNPDVVVEIRRGFRYQ